MRVNRFDTFISRETLPKIRTMQRHDDNNNSDAPTFAANNTYGSQLKVKGQRLAIVFLVAASLGLLVIVILLTRAYLSYKPAFQLLGYISTILFSAGAFTLSNAQKIVKLVKTEQKRFVYIIFFTGTVLLFLSLFWLLFILYQLEHGWWGYFYGAIMLVGFMIWPFSQVVDEERKLTNIILDFISHVLVLVAFCSICIDVLDVV